MEFPWKLAVARQCRFHRGQRDFVLFEYRLSIQLPISPLAHGLVTARSSPVKSYLVTARNMLRGAHLFAFTYRSGAAFPGRRGIARQHRVETIENTPSRASLVDGFRNPRLADAASRRLAWFSICRTVADDDDDRMEIAVTRRPEGERSRAQRRRGTRVRVGASRCSPFALTVIRGKEIWNLEPHVSFAA